MGKRDTVYRDYFKQVLSEIVKDSHEGSILYCSNDDQGLMQSLKEEVTAGQKEIKKFAIETDGSIEGGFLFRDSQGGRTFNYTLDRLVYRKMEAIRREVYQAIAENITYT